MAKHTLVDVELVGTSVKFTNLKLVQVKSPVDLVHFDLDRGLILFTTGCWSDGCSFHVERTGDPVERALVVGDKRLPITKYTIIKTQHAFLHVDRLDDGFRITHNSALFEEGVLFSAVTDIKITKSE